MSRFDIFLFVFLTGHLLPTVQADACGLADATGGSCAPLGVLEDVSLLQTHSLPDQRSTGPEAVQEKENPSKTNSLVQKHGEECWQDCAPQCPVTCGSYGGYQEAVVEYQNEQPCGPQGAPCAPAVQPARIMQPTHGSCTPQCTWECGSQKCDEVCHPVCKPPECETRCTGTLDSSACHMECQTPHCTVVCPKNGCPNANCPQCCTTCTPPMCKMLCDASAQPCRNVCKKPECTWECHAPLDCPKPDCKLTCETAPNCLGNTYSEVPALQPGECSVASFDAPSNVSNHTNHTPQNVIASAMHHLLNNGTHGGSHGPHGIPLPGGHGLNQVNSKISVQLATVPLNSSKVSLMQIELPVVEIENEES